MSKEEQAIPPYFPELAVMRPIEGVSFEGGVPEGHEGPYIPTEEEIRAALESATGRQSIGIALTEEIATQLTRGVSRRIDLPS